MKKGRQSVFLDGHSLTVDDLALLARNPAVRVDHDPSLRRVRQTHALIEGIVKQYEHDLRVNRTPTQTYGVTTGFGEFKDKPIRPEDVNELQRNILLSHSVGVGETTDRDDPGNYFRPEVVRATLAIRLNTFLQGHSGVSPTLIKWLTSMLNAGVIPLVPIRGSVGASGDLAPLCHLFGVLLGEGRFYVAGDKAALAAIPFGKSSKAKRRDGVLGAELMPRILGEPKPFEIGPKEGLALSNGATFSAALLGLAAYDAANILDVADVVHAMSLEAVCGCRRAFDPKVHAARKMAGQIASARLIRQMIVGSKLVGRAQAIQDVYSLRCAPQVHGAARDALGYSEAVVQSEINAATDNPLFFAPDAVAYSAGNFHGQPVGLAADFLTIALSEVASISERRTQMLLDEHWNRNLPANLTAKPGVNSGFMIAQYCAASLVSENKVLAHPASVDSIPTSANSEDHVSMSTIAARKLRTVIGNVQAVLAIEALIAAQALEWRAVMGEHDRRRSTKPTPVTSRVGKSTRAGMSPSSDSASDVAEGWKEAWEEAEREEKRFATNTGGTTRTNVARKLGRGTRAAYLVVRDAAEPLVEDRALDEDIRRVRQVIEEGVLRERVHSALGR